MNRFYIGIDVGGGSIKYGLYDKNKKFLDKYSVKTPKFKSNSEKQLIEFIINVIDEQIIGPKHGVTRKNIAGIGLAVPGPVVNNVIIRAVNIGWKKKFDIVGAIKKHFGKDVKVSVGNDANVAALGEYTKSLKGKYDSICLFTLGTGVGVGIIIEGKVIEGKCGVAGELSHLKVDFSKDAVKCNCGNTGCLETVSSGAGMTNLYNRTYHTNIAKDARDVIRPAKAGNKKAYDVMYRSLDYLSNVMAMVMLVYEPEVILIGGGVSYEGSYITDILKKQLKEKVYITKKIPKIMIAKLRNEAGMYGSIVNL